MLFEHGLFTTESWVSEEKQHFINMEVAAARAAEHRGNSMYSEEEPGRRPPSAKRSEHVLTSPYDMVRGGDGSTAAWQFHGTREKRAQGKSGN